MAIRVRLTLVLAVVSVLVPLFATAQAQEQEPLGTQVPNLVQGAFAGGGPEATTTTEVALPGEALELQVKPIGRRAAEPTIAVDSDGAAFVPAGNFDGARPAGARTDLMRSLDGGLTFESVQPPLPSPVDGEPPVNLDPYVWHDPATDRVISADLLGCGYLLITDDKGENYTRSLAGCVDSVDHQTIFGGPPPVGQIVPDLGIVDYPSNLYYCTNRVGDSKCSRSFDGGITWITTLTPAYLGFDPELGGICGGLHGHGVVDPEGRVLLPKGHCLEPYLSISEDAGDTWTRVRVSEKAAGGEFPLPLFEYPTTFAHTSVASDSAGNYYYVFLDENQLPWLVYSTDQGQTWSEDILVAPPGVTEANLPTVTAGDEGRIAIIFPAHVPRENEEELDPLTRPWNYYAMISTDVLSGSPTFTYTLANDPADPIYRGDCFSRCGGLYDFLDVIVSPAGEMWSTMADSCMDERCMGDNGVDDSFSCDPTDPLDPCFGSGEARDAVGNPGMGIAIRQLGGPSLVDAAVTPAPDPTTPAPAPVVTTTPAPAPSASATAAPAPAPTSGGPSLPATGAGMAGAALLLASLAFRRRRED